MIVDGKPGDPELECFPDALKFKLAADGKIASEPVELLAADAREEGDGKSLALAKVVAGLLGVPSDDIFRRAQRERRRQSRIRSTIGLVIAGLLLAGTLLAWQSYQQQRTIAEVKAIVAKYSVPGSANASHTLVSNDFFDAGLSKAVTAIAEGAGGDGRYAKALELLEAGKPTEAEPLLKAVAEQEKLRAAHESERAAAAYVNLGSITRLSDPKRALEAYSEAVALDPDNAEALFWHARLQEDAGNFDVAEQGYKRLLALEKDGKCKNCRYDLMTATEDRLRDLDMERFQTRPDTPANF